MPVQRAVASAMRTAPGFGPLSQTVQDHFIRGVSRRVHTQPSPPQSDHSLRFFSTPGRIRRPTVLLRDIIAHCAPDCDFNRPDQSQLTARARLALTILCRPDSLRFLRWEFGQGHPSSTTIFHECGHTLFPEYGEYSTVQHHAPEKAQSDPDREFENLCDVAAAEMLFP